MGEWVRGWVGEWLGGWVNGMGGVCVVWCGVCRQESVWRLVECDAFLLFPSEQDVAHKHGRRVQVVTPLVCLSVAFASSQGTTMLVLNRRASGVVGGKWVGTWQIVSWEGGVEQLCG